jgi:hypothetical protein
VTTLLRERTAVAAALKDELDALNQRQEHIASVKVGLCEWNPVDP